MTDKELLESTFKKLKIEFKTEDYEDGSDLVLINPSENSHCTFMFGRSGDFIYNNFIKYLYVDEEDDEGKEDKIIRRVL